MNNLPAFVSPLNDLAVIEISGPDAVSFMQSQLTQDVASLTPDHAVLAGYCSPKGRLLGTMVLWSTPKPDDTPCLCALVKADIAESLVKRLSMFVLRAQAKLAIANLSVWGLVLPTQALEPFPLESFADAGITSAAGQLYAAIELLPVQPAPYSCIHTDTGLWIAAPSTTDSPTRWWHISHIINPEAQADQGWWNAADIAAGLPWITSTIQDLFIPQTLNLELLQGVSFTKGCYPGQEVVARSHYRGTVKRRMAYGVVAATDAIDLGTPEELAGRDIYDAKQAEHPCGRIVNAALGHDDQMHLLLEVQLADLGIADFRLGQPTGAVITIRDLPYSIQATSA
ncbi:folate-binding protein YgfZ [Alcaligenaceae bacterium]|nr:folate-binding protein YgfZ [Alcaligenaceae bacterium]